jgi:hypothetical protein
MFLCPYLPNEISAGQSGTTNHSLRIYFGNLQILMSYVYTQEYWLAGVIMGSFSLVIPELLTKIVYNYSLC